jgi:hypothetical protein
VKEAGVHPHPQQAGQKIPSSLIIARHKVDIIFVSFFISTAEA